MTSGWAMRKASTCGTGQDEAAQRPRREDVRRGGLAEQDRDLAEELAATQRRPLGAVDDDLDLAVDDDVEAPSRRRPGGGPARPTGKVRSSMDVGDALELGLAEVGEQVQPGDRVDEFLVGGHGLHRATSPSRRWPAPAPVATLTLATTGGAASAVTTPPDPQENRPMTDDRRPPHRPAGGGAAPRRGRCRRAWRASPSGSSRSTSSRAGHRPAGRRRDGAVHHRQRQRARRPRRRHHRDPRAGRVLRGAVGARRPATHGTGRGRRADRLPGARRAGTSKRSCTSARTCRWRHARAGPPVARADRGAPSLIRSTS